MIGRALSHYHIVEKIGAGGMGEVYRAQDEHLGREVAIKVLPAGALSDEQTRKRFRKEALALSRLNHPHIATVHDFDTEEGVDFLVMELVEGTSLAERVKTGPLPEKEISALGSQIADALDEAHERGIIHKDLKPGNILVTQKERVKVLDFGLARMFRPVSDEATTEALTEAQTVAGTLPYMAPEELRGERADHRSDIYSFGVVLYEMATGKRPFEERLSTKLTDAILHQAPEPPSTHNRKISPGLEGVILKALDKDPERRYQSAREMRVDLERLTAPLTLGSPQRRVRVRPWTWVGAAAVIVAALAAGAFLWVGGARAPKMDAIAVLPLENLSGDPEQEYFADGMTEALIAHLAKLPSIKVISRTSVMQYKGAMKPLPEIARELGVDAVVEGSVHRAGNRVRITAQLIHASTDQHIWAESYERDISDILTLQSDLALAVARQIQVEAKEQERLTGSSGSVDPEAYQAYLRGLHAFQNGADTGGGERYVERAIELDSDFAPAHALLAILCMWQADVSPPEKSLELFQKAKRSAMRALELDATLGLAHTALGDVSAFADWNWVEAESEFQRGIELSPNDAFAHDEYRAYLALTGRFDESLLEINRILELDPLSPLYRRYPGWLYFWARRYDESILELEKLPELRDASGDPLWRAWPLGMLASAYCFAGRSEEALATCERLRSFLPLGRAIFWDATIAYVYGVTGRRAEALEILETWRNRPDREPHALAVMCAGLGQTDEAMEWLNTAVQERSSQVCLLKFDPRLDSLRDDPRFDELLRRVNFPK